VASRSDPGDALLGMWPGLAERPDVRYVVRDWLAKLRIVAAGLAITTIAPIMLDPLPDGVTVLAVRGEPQETRRVVLARRPGPLDGPAALVVDALISATRQPRRSAGVAQSAGDSVDRQQADPLELGVGHVAERRAPAKQLDLNERQRVDVGVAAIDRGLQDGF